MVNDLDLHTIDSRREDRFDSRPAQLTSPPSADSPGLSDGRWVIRGQAENAMEVISKTLCALNARAAAVAAHPELATAQAMLQQYIQKYSLPEPSRGGD